MRIYHDDLIVDISFKIDDIDGVSEEECRLILQFLPDLFADMLQLLNEEQD